MRYVYTDQCAIWNPLLLSKQDTFFYIFIFYNEFMKWSWKNNTLFSLLLITQVQILHRCIIEDSIIGTFNENLSNRFLTVDLNKVCKTNKNRKNLQFIIKVYLSVLLLDTHDHCFICYFTVFVSFFKVTFKLKIMIEPF